jgi:hypothetical protein
MGWGMILEIHVDFNSMPRSDLWHRISLTQEFAEGKPCFGPDEIGPSAFFVEAPPSARVYMKRTQNSRLMCAIILK